MNIASSVNVYLKTTETCNLNCKHCFTSGSTGAKIFFDPGKTLDFFRRLKLSCPWVKNIRFMFHGGEPMLAPAVAIRKAYLGLTEIYPSARFSIQTNLVYELTDEKRKLFLDLFYRDGFGTSWDYDIRFGSVATDPESQLALAAKQRLLWENNVRTLIADGHQITMIVSITKKLIQEKEPIDVIRYARDLGFPYILFERITDDGNAKLNHEIVPSNREQDEWLYRMFRQTIDTQAYKYIGNMFLAELAESYVNRVHVGNRCRICEKSLLTINADGSIAGCPNTAPANYWGHIDWPIEKSLKSEKRLRAIHCEAVERNSECYTCSAFSLCNSDCNKISWDEENKYCPAPKKIWQEMLRLSDEETYRKLLLTDVGASAHA